MDDIELSKTVIEDNTTISMVAISHAAARDKTHTYIIIILNPGIKEGDEIILPALTCVVVPNAIAQAIRKLFTMNPKERKEM